MKAQQVQGSRQRRVEGAGASDRGADVPAALPDVDGPDRRPEESADHAERSGPRIHRGARPGAGGGEGLTMAEESKQHKNEKVGEVVSTKMAKTIVVSVSRRVPHPLYKRIVTKRKKFYAHDEDGAAQYRRYRPDHRVPPAEQAEAVAVGRSRAQGGAGCGAAQGFGREDLRAVSVRLSAVSKGC